MRSVRSPTASILSEQGAAQDSVAELLARMLFHGLADISQEDGLLARYAGPALLVDAGPRVIAVNLVGAVLAEALSGGRAPDLARLIATCITNNAARHQEVHLAGDDGGTTMEASVLPTGDSVTALVLCRDVTLDRNFRVALSESRQRYKDLVEIVSDFAWETAPDGQFTFVSPRGALGYTAAELIGRSPSELAVQTPDQSRPDNLPFSTRESVENVQVWLRRNDGATACMSTSALPLFDADGNWLGARGICRDVTDMLARDAALASANTRERLLSHILRTVRDESEPSDMLTAAAEATAQALNAGACLIFRGQDAATFRSAAAFGAVVGSADVATLLAEAVAAEGPVARAGWLVAVTYYRRAINGVVALWRTGGERAWGSDDQMLLASVADHLGIAMAQIANHEQLRDLSRTDDLTGLLNRRTFYAELERRWHRACRAGGGALIYCDLDNFKLVNDRFGHASGDQTLRRIAELLAGMTRGRDLVARLGGDEFALWLEDADTHTAQRKAEGLLAGIGGLAHLTGDPAFPLAVSLGIALPARAPGRAETLEGFLARADAAMYEAKRTGKGRIVLANPPPAVQVGS